LTKFAISLLDFLSCKNLKLGFDFDKLEDYNQLEGVNLKAKYESGSETAVKRGEGAMRGREKMLCLLDGGTGRHGSE